MDDSSELEPHSKPPPEPTDARDVGDWKTRYPAEAWRCIWLEFCYLAALLSVVTIALLLFGYGLAVSSGKSVSVPFTSVEIPRSLVKWVITGLAGMVGGIAFDLKWLYHSVAKRIWNQDRLIWRIVVPFASGLIATFSGFLIVSGIIPFLRGESFKSLYFSLGYGFLIGYFSDNVLAAMKKLADSVFGRTGSGNSSSFLNTE